MPRHDLEQRTVSAGMELVLRLSLDLGAEQRLVDASRDYWELGAPESSGRIGRFFARRAATVFAEHGLSEDDQERMREQVRVEIVAPRCATDGASLGHVRSRKELHEVVTPNVCAQCRQAGTGVDVA